MTTKTLRCALLSSFTLDRLPNEVNARLRADAIECQWFVSPYNQYPQEILGDQSELYRFAPQLVFVAVAIEDLLADLPESASAAETTALAQNRIQEFAGLLRHLAKRLPSSSIFIHDFLQLQPIAAGLPGLKSQAGAASISLRANLALADLCAEFQNLFTLDLRDTLQTCGNRAFDARFFYIAKMRLSNAALAALADRYRRIILAFLGRQKKCLVLDLDNTLWGGIIGEDGPEGLQISDDGPGKAFQDFQRIILALGRTGTILAICSKNDHDLAFSALRDHPAMLIRPHHLAAMRINWQDKSANLRAIATELNIGLDSMVFLDDSAFEREHVRGILPEVTVPELPTDPSDYPAFAAQMPWFDSLTVTEEDRQRGKMYVEDRQRRELKDQAVTLDEFLRELNLQVCVRRTDKFTMSRLAQLTQRTNQFNLTNRRYTEDELNALEATGSWRLYVSEARDRIGQSGIVGGAVAQLHNGTARIDTFVMSCRVLGRGVETAFMAAVLSDLARAGAAKVQAEFLPSARNGMAREFLPNAGFAKVGSAWERPLADLDALRPRWIQLNFEEKKHDA